MMIFNEFCVGLLDDLLYVVSLLLFVDVIDLYFELVFVIVVGFEVCVQYVLIDMGVELVLIVCNLNVGVVVNFFGVVCKEGDVDDVVVLEVEYYLMMIEQVLWSIVEEVIVCWWFEVVRIVYCVGCILFGQLVVLVVVVVVYCVFVFDVCEFLMDFLKIYVLFWKKEIWYDGEFGWVEVKVYDDLVMWCWG